MLRNGRLSSAHTKWAIDCFDWSWRNNTFELGVPQSALEKRCARSDRLHYVDCWRFRFIAIPHCHLAFWRQPVYVSPIGKYGKAPAAAGFNGEGLPFIWWISDKV